jgi:3-deoxy-D-manno-octulosonate 8-phosphate phosphatase (KDO 8-P phosphatase)
VDRVVSLLAARASKIRLVLTDCDGVLTDAGVYYGDQGEVLKRFSIRDGMGVERLRDAGIRAAIMTGERSESIRQRAEKLQIRAYVGVKDKAAALAEAMAEHGASLATTAFIGDDVNDLAVMDLLADEGLLGCPSDAVREIRERVHWVGTVPGGHGAFREFAELILASGAGSHR